MQIPACCGQNTHTNMAASTTTNKVLIDAQKIVDTWAANLTFKLGEVTQAGFTTSRTELETLDNLIETRRNELKGLINDRDDKTKELQALVTRARSGFRATYGPDSTQYDQAGGTRLSEHKSRARTKAVAAGK